MSPSQRPRGRNISVSIYLIVLIGVLACIILANVLVFWMRQP